MGDLKTYPRPLYQDLGRDTNISFHHMSRNCKQYRINQLKMNLFQKNFVIPSYVKGEKNHIIKSNEINRIDTISWNYYGNPELWWFIAYVNNIDPFELKEGQNLRILPSEYIELNLFRYMDD
ncbi:hypothetical protein EOM09_02930, partial [bacterium]|nr:hypothetical protein [bacterium]